MCDSVVGDFFPKQDPQHDLCLFNQQPSAMPLGTQSECHCKFQVFYSDFWHLSFWDLDSLPILE